MSAVSVHIHHTRDTLLTGLYPRVKTLLENLVKKARRRLHYSLSLDMSPFSKELEDGEVGMNLAIREDVRRWLRDLDEASMENIFSPYVTFLLADPFALEDLLPMSMISIVANRLSVICLSIASSLSISTTYSTPNTVLATRVLPSLASFTSDLANSLVSLLETNNVSEPWVDDVDLEIFGVRCLMLFYFADLVVKWLLHLGARDYDVVGGDFSGIGFIDGADISMMEKWTRECAGKLARNWVAWEAFVEGLPQRLFRMRENHDGLIRSVKN